MSINSKFTINDVLLNQESLQKKNKYSCPICFEFFYKKSIYQCKSGHMACQQCWEKSLKNKKQCMICISKVNSTNDLSRCLVIEQDFGKKECYCIYSFNNFIDCANQEKITLKKDEENGCKEIISVDQLDRHIENCKFKFVKCSHIGCEIVLRLNSLEEHENKCGFKLVKCKYCDCDDTIQKELENHHGGCSKFPIDCPQSCSIMVERDQIKSHIDRDCNNSIIQCKYYEYGCKVEMKRSDLQNHLKNVNHQYFMGLLIEKLSSSLTQSHSIQDELVKKIVQSERTQYNLIKELEQSKLYNELEQSNLYKELEQSKIICDKLVKKIEQSEKSQEKLFKEFDQSKINSDKLVKKNEQSEKTQEKLIIEFDLSKINSDKLVKKIEQSEKTQEKLIKEFDLSKINSDKLVKKIEQSEKTQEKFIKEFDQSKIICDKLQNFTCSLEFLYLPEYKNNWIISDYSKVVDKFPKASELKSPSFGINSNNIFKSPPPEILSNEFRIGIFPNGDLTQSGKMSIFLRGNKIKATSIEFICKLINVLDKTKSKELKFQHGNREWDWVLGWQFMESKLITQENGWISKDDKLTIKFKVKLINNFIKPLES
ncbi:hypothetical protein ACTFIR_002735 [Dictyostelium discoideum]